MAQAVACVVPVLPQRRNADLEQQLEDAIVAAMSSPRMRGVMMDLLERWRRVGGSHYIAGPLW